MEYYKIEEKTYKEKVTLYNVCDLCEVKLHPHATHDYSVRVEDYWSSYTDSSSETDEAILCRDCYELILKELKILIPNLGLNRGIEVKDEI